MLKASALEKLKRVDDALVEIDEAISLVETYAPAWEQRGKILWAAHRFDEARPALERFLELDPTAPNAAQIRAQLAEQK
jgi:tetratricopeptide (TPR) repeat protein